MKQRFQYKNEFLKLIIEEDVVGFYLINYNNPNSSKSNFDFLLDSLEEALQEANERFGIKKNQWVLEDLNTKK